MVSPWSSLQRSVQWSAHCLSCSVPVLGLLGIFPISAAPNPPWWRCGSLHVLLCNWVSGTAVAQPQCLGLRRSSASVPADYLEPPIDPLPFATLAHYKQIEVDPFARIGQERAHKERLVLHTRLLFLP